MKATEILRSIWRPLTAFVLLAIIVFAKAIAPLLGIQIELGDNFWSFVKFFYTAYILSRGAEKISQKFAGGS